MPTRVTTGAKEPVTVSSAGSSAASTPRRLVMPKAQTTPRSSSRSASEAKSSSSFGLELGKPASIICTPRPSSAFTTRAFSAAENDIPSPCMPSRRVVS